MPAGRVPALHLPDRLVIDLDPPEHAFTQVRRAAHLTREALSEFGLASVPIATGSKGYHVVAALTPTLEAETLAFATQKLAALLVAKHPDALSGAYRIALAIRN